MEKDVVKTRRDRLRQWIKENCNGEQAKLVGLIGINAGELSGLLRSKHFGEKKARSLEKQLELPPGWLDSSATDEWVSDDLRDQVQWLIDNADQEIKTMFNLMVRAMYLKKKNNKKDQELLKTG